LPEICRMQSLNILLLEDDPVIAYDLKTTLEFEGFTVYTTHHPAEAIHLCERYLPDLAILNFQQQNEQDGMLLARLMRTRYLVGTLVVTGVRPRDLVQSQGFYAGQEVLFKPFTRRQLRAAIVRLTEAALCY